MLPFLRCLSLAQERQYWEANVLQRGLVGRILAAALAAWGVALPAHAQEKPPGFVALADIDPTIVQDLRYATANNFTGARVPGYTTGACSLTRQTALALARVQKDLAAEALSLKVYDCYRPVAATNAFVEWARGPDSQDALKRYHPRLARGSLIPLGYISADSNHTKGTTVDLTLVAEISKGIATGNGAPSAPLDFDCGAEPDGTVDMGTGYDCLDPKSHQGAAGLNPEQLRWRRKLAAAMARRGFRGYVREWWHFTLAGQ